MEKKYFIVSSHGWSASNWLAYSLNLHEQVICTHSAINILPDPDFIHEQSGLKKNIRQFHKGYISRVNTGIDEHYDHICSLGDARAYGSVHLYRLRDIPTQPGSSATLKRQYTLVNMIRNPVSLVWSGYGQFRQLFRFDLNELHWTLGKLLKTDMEFALEIGDKHDLYVGDYDVLAFLCACRVLESLRLDFDAEDKILAGALSASIHYRGHVLMEKLTADRHYFSQLFGLLGLDNVATDPAYLDRVFATGKLNAHNDAQLSADNKSQGVFESWLPWQKEAFLHFFNKYDLLRPYTDKGYALDFIAHH